MADQLFTEKTGDISKFTGFLLTGIDKVPVPVIDNNNILIRVISGPPEFTRRPAVAIARKTFI